jgi:RHS repeat-associated protein
MWGPLASVNTYRFSSKEMDLQSGDYYYGYRYYEPNYQRWLNRNPIQEAGGINLYQFVDNNPINEVDIDGLWGVQVGSVNFGYGDPNLVFDHEVWDETKEGWHTGLDAIGTIEPTPFADSVNSALYGLEGDWSNAGISAAGMIPYVGDTAKLGKYGKTICKVAKETTGQTHHVISTKVWKAAESHPKIKDAFTRRDPRFVTQAVDDASHRG